MKNYWGGELIETYIKKYIYLRKHALKEGIDWNKSKKKAKKKSNDNLVVTGVIQINKKTKWLGL